MAYIKTPCPNRDIVKVLKIQHLVNLNGVTPEHGPVGQNQIHINLINYKHRCMRQFFREFFGESHRYNQLEVKISVFSTTLHS